MKEKIEIPRIKTIEAIDHFKVVCAFNTGDYRSIDFKKIFQLWDERAEKYPLELKNTTIFRTVEVVNHTLTWNAIKRNIQLSNGLSFEVSYDIDPIVLFENSIHEKAII
ncbi:MAG: hypothetical protein ACPG19_10720 [Saprospiraceae bacterium]